jgi:thiol-disulfide isomerase/thioredoxin
MNKKNTLLLIVILVVVTALALVTYYVRTKALKESQNEANNTLFSPSPSATFLDAQSNEVSLEKYKDKILVVNVWASWSPYAAVEFPILNEVAEKFSNQGVHILAMNRKENQTQIERYLATIPLYDKIEYITDVNDFFYSGVDGFAMPETIIFDADGKIIRHLRGVLVQSELEALLTELVKE